MIKQRTINQSVEFSGLGLHSGKIADISLRPAPANTGIIARRVDLDPVVDIPLRIHHTKPSRLCTMVAHQGAQLQTIEHLLSALSALGIDNLWIDINSEEMPICDGSSAPLLYLLQNAGIRVLEAPKRFLKIHEPVEVRNGSCVARLEPYDGFRLDFAIEFDHPVIDNKSNHMVFDFGRMNYATEIARARTFGFIHELEQLIEAGLARGGSMSNAVVLDQHRVLNDGGLRYEDEFIRHKILDAIGDLYLCGGAIIGSFVGVRSGHALNQSLIKAVLSNPQAYTWVEFANQSRPLLPACLSQWLNDTSGLPSPQHA